MGDLVAERCRKLPEGGYEVMGDLHKPLRMRMVDVALAITQHRAEDMTRSENVKASKTFELYTPQMHVFLLYAHLRKPNQFVQVIDTAAVNGDNITLV